MPSKVKLLGKDVLETMHTGSLLKRRNDLLACEESFELSDRFGSENIPNPKDTGFIEFKDTPEWKQSYSEVKNILSLRENLPNRKDRKKERKHHKNR